MLKRTAAPPLALHQHRRELAALGHDFAAAEAQAVSPGICHGSRALFRKQHYLDENGYADHAARLSDWRAARSSEFMVEGEARSPTGNQFVRLTAGGEPGTFDQEERLPPALHRLAERRRFESGHDIAAF